MFNKVFYLNNYSLFSGKNSEVYKGVDFTWGMVKPSYPPRMISVINQHIDLILARLGLNAGLLYGVAQVAERFPDLSSPTKFILSAAAAAGIVAADNLIYPPLRPALRYAPSNRGAGLLKTLSLSAALALPIAGLHQEINAVTRDVAAGIEGLLDPETDARVEPAEPKNVTPQNTKDLLASLGYTERVKVAFPDVKLADKDSLNGRIQRTIRWKPFTDAVEKRYGIPEGVLLGLIMQESYGDPLQPNASDDGGIGLVHTQGTTARKLGLKIYGTSTSAADNNHGKSLAAMFQRCNYDFSCVSKSDDRAHPLKNLDAIARYVKEGYDFAKGKKVSDTKAWNAGLVWVRGPGFASAYLGLPTHYRASRAQKAEKYLGRVTGFTEAIFDEAKVDGARQDFNKRNAGRYTFDDFVDTFHRAAVNFGVDTYKKSI